MVVLRVCGFLFLSLTLVAACGKKKSDDDKKEEELGQLEIPVSASEAIGKVTAALASAAEIESESGVTLNPGALQTSLAGAKDFCKASGTPKDEIYTNSTGEYAALFAYCSFAMRPDGPDTIMGAIDRVQGWLCAMGELEFDGESHDIDFEITTDCFSEAFVEMAAAEGLTKTTATVIAGEPKDAVDVDTDSFTTGIRFEIPDIEVNYDILYTQEAAVLAAAIKSGSGENDEDGDYFAVYLDRGSDGEGTGIVRVDGSFTTITSQEQGMPNARHVRAFVTGPYDVDKGTLTGVVNLEFASWDYSSLSGANVSTLAGNPSDGYMARYATASVGDALTLASGYTTTDSQKLCYGDGDCDGNPGLLIDNNKKLFFASSIVYGNASYVSSTTKFSDYGPLDFDGVDFTK